jgi:hypothetical protein
MKPKRIESERYGTKVLRVRKQKGYGTMVKASQGRMEEEGMRGE